MEKPTTKIISKEEAENIVAKLRSDEVSERLIQAKLRSEDNFANWFQEEVQAEYASSVKLHGNFNSYHEAYGVILEEVDELWDEVKKKSKDRDPEKITKELLQIAAMCQKLAFDMRFGFGNKKD